VAEYMADECRALGARPSFYDIATKYGTDKVTFHSYHRYACSLSPIRCPCLPTHSPLIPSEFQIYSALAYLPQFRPNAILEKDHADPPIFQHV
jgi:hypothetical protein